MTRYTSFLLLTFVFLFQSCKKNIDSGVSDISGINSSKECKCSNEQAFPDIPSELISISAGSNEKEIFIEKKGEHYVYSGDIILTEEQVDLLSNNAQQRTALSDFAKRWGGGIVYYKINSGLANPQRVTDAISHWQSNTGVRFIPRTTQPDYVEFVTSTGCSSYLGKKGGRQEVFLAPGCSTGNVIHEIGHAIGFFHEQSRADRDNTIQIHWNNIINGMQSNFQTYVQLGIPGFEIGTFDFNSIMLYDSWAFSNNGLPTITTLSGGTFFTQRNGLSTGDIETSNFMYGPPFAKFRVAIISTYDDGYLKTSEYEYFLDFYQDQACTIPTTMPADRNLIANKIVRDFNYGSWVVTSDYSYPVFVPAGASTVSIGTAFNSEESTEYNGEVTIYSGHTEYCYTREALLR